MRKQSEIGMTSNSSRPGKKENGVYHEKEGEDSTNLASPSTGIHARSNTAFLWASQAAQSREKRENIISSSQQNDSRIEKAVAVAPVE